MNLKSADIVWFRALHYGGPHLCLWIAILPDGALHVRSERHWLRGVIGAVARDMRSQTAALGIPAVRYTVAESAQMIGKESDDYGETRLDTFRANQISIRTQTHDPIQGWTRITELLATRPDGRPWLTVDPSCEHLIRALTTAVSDPSSTEEVLAFPDDQALRALRVGVMSRPTPKLFEKPPLPKNAVGRLLEECRTGGEEKRWLVWR